MEIENIQALYESRRRTLEAREQEERASRKRSKMRRMLDVEATLDRLQKLKKLPRNFNRNAASEADKRRIAILSCIAHMVRCIDMAGNDVEPNPPSGSLIKFL